MIGSSKSEGPRSVSIGGDSKGNVIQTGDQNVASTSNILFPDVQTINILDEIHSIKELLSGLDTEHRDNIDNALEEAEREAVKTKLNKNRIGQAVERALSYAKKANDFSDVVEKLTPRIINTVAWLGAHWNKLL